MNNYNFDVSNLDDDSNESNSNKKPQYNLNNPKINSSDFFKTDIKTSQLMNNNNDSKKENEKKENEKKPKKSEDNNQFLADLDEEFGDSGVNNNTSKVVQSQSSHSRKNSKTMNKSTKKSINQSQNKNQNLIKKSIDNDNEEEIGINRDEINEDDEIEEIENIKEEKKDDRNEAEKKLSMEQYLQKHNKFPINQKVNEQNVSNKQINEEKSIEENINENRNENKEEEDDDYGGFDVNINSETNIQNNQTSSIAQSKKKNSKNNNINNNNNNNSTMNKQVVSSDSYNNYLGEFEQSKINEINKIEEKNKKNNNDNTHNIDLLIKEVNNEHNKYTQNLEKSINNNNINNNSNNFNIYSNNSINNLGSGDSINVNKIIKKEVSKYDANDIIKNDFNSNNNDNKKNNKINNNKIKDYNKDTNKNNKSIEFKEKGSDLLLKKKHEEAIRSHKNKIEELQTKLNNLEEENQKLSEEIDNINNQKNQYIKELKLRYDNSLKNNEMTIINREKKKSENLIKDMENKYQVDIIQKETEIQKLKSEYDYLENRYNMINNEYKKLKDSNEKNEQLNELKSENYRLKQQINEFKSKKNKNLENINKKGDDDNINKKSDTQKIYEQILNEREINTQEKLLNNYLKEIKKLNEEIIFLKSLNSISNKNPINQNNNVSNKSDINFNNNNLKINNYVINPSLKESAEKQIKKLQNFLLPSDDDPTNNKLIILEKELTRLQNKESPNEITFTNFTTVMKQLQVPLTSSELIEIFNNFPRIKGDRIRMNDFLNAINSKSPSAFFLQSDPTYLNELENKLIKAQNRIKELEKFILVNNNETEEFKAQLEKTLDENKILKKKINELNEQILKYFLFREEKNLSNPDVIQMKEKMRTMEIKSKTMDNELNEKLGKYEQRIEYMQKTYEDEKNNLIKEKDGFKEQINKLKSDNEKYKNDYDKKEIVLKTEIAQLNEKLQKYKKNYNILSTKNEMNKREKERILNSFKEKGFDPEHIMTFVNNSTNIQEILNKINELERKNLNREEIYKRICMEVNQTQVNKELEKMRIKYEVEKKGLLKIIAQKNNELNKIKSEFFDIMTDLEKLKATNKFK